MLLQNWMCEHLRQCVGGAVLYSVAEVRIFAEALDHPEGVAVGQDGTVYTGGEGGQVYRISPDGKKVEVIAQTGGFCLGITLDEQDGIYVCDASRKQVLKVGQNGQVHVLAESVDGRKFENPNFSVFDSRANLYVSDSGEWKKANGFICRINSDGHAQMFCAGPFHFTNGLALDVDEKYLYVVESNLDRVLRVEIQADGRAGLAEVFAEGLVHVPDGLAFDAAGNLYVTTYGSSAIYRINRRREVSLLCQDTENEVLCLATNCAFAGPEFDQLLVANLGHHHISALDLKIKGQPLWNHRRGHKIEVKKAG
jgi:gluconolactonase